MAGLKLNLFGGFAARSATGETLTLSMRRAQALLAYLALLPGQGHPRDKLTALFWPELDRDEARARLRHTLFTIRRAFGDASSSGLHMEADTVALDPNTVDVDTVAFERLARARDRRSLEEAAELYRGDLLAGLPAREGPFEEWLTLQRERLRELAVESLTRLLRFQTDGGEPDAAVQTALRLLELDALQEDVHRALMRLYLQLGRRGAALRQYQQCVAVLQRELGAEPDDDTKSVYRDIVRAPSSPRPVARPRPSGVPRAVAPAGDTPLVGRAAELSRLREALDDATKSAGRAVIVSGEAGAGKSRLVTELATEAVRRGALVLVGRSHATERILPFNPWIEALRSAPPADLRAVASAASKPTLAELGRLVPEIAEAPPTSRPESEGWRALFDAVTEILRRSSEARPVVVVLEDLHWADDMTLRLLAFVARRVGAWATLVLCTVREEEVDDAALLRSMLSELATEPHVRHVQLQPLSMEEIARLTALVTRSADAAVRRDLAAQAWRTSQGNPLVAVETVRALRARPADAPEARLPLPERVRDLIRERFGRLGETARELLPVAALIGRDFDFALLHRAAGLDEEPVAAAVEELVRRRVLQGLGERFDFTHDRVREVAHGDVLAPRRRLVHRRIGEAIEALHGDRLERHVAALAVHFRDGEVWDKAAGYLKRAAWNAWQRSAFRESSELANEALRALELVPRSRATLELVVDIRLQLHRSHYSLGMFVKAWEHLRVAEAAVAELDDPARKARVAIYLDEICRVEGDLDRAIAYGEQGLRLAADVGDDFLVVEAHFHQAVARIARGELDLARAHLETGVRTGERWPLARQVGYPYVVCLTRLARIAAARGEFDEARRFVQATFEIADATEHPFTCAEAYHTAGLIAAAQGAFAEAVPALEQAIRMSEEHHIRVQYPLLPAQLGHALTKVGRVDEGLRVLEPLFAQRITIQNSPFSTTWGLLAAGFYEAGRLDDARAAAEHGIALTTAHGERFYAPDVMLQLARIEAAASPPRGTDAEARFAHALERARAMGRRPIVAHCHLGLGRLAAVRGDATAAREQLTRAIELYRAMDMDSYVREAQTAIAGL